MLRNARQAFTVDCRMLPSISVAQQEHAVWPGKANALRGSRTFRGHSFSLKLRVVLPRVLHASLVIVGWSVRRHPCTAES